MKSLKEFRTWGLGVGFGLGIWAFLLVVRQSSAQIETIGGGISASSVTNILFSTQLWTNDAGILRATTNAPIVVSNSITANGSSTNVGNFYTEGTINPLTDDTYTLGTVSRAWTGIFVKGAGVQFKETGGGAEFVNVVAPASLAASYGLSWPNAQGAAGTVLVNDGTGVLTWSNALTGVTNFMNFSVQAAKLPATNYPGIDGGNQNWEVLYYHTNAENAVANLSAVWQFVVPPDYKTNTGKLHVQHTLLATNGPNSSNVVFTVDCVRSHSGDNVNLHTAAFGTQVSGTNTWAQSSTIVHAQTDLVINLNTNLMWQAGDLVVMRLTRNLTNDTYRSTGVGLVGLQLEYTRQ